MFADTSNNVDEANGPRFLFAPKSTDKTNLNKLTDMNKMSSINSLIVKAYDALVNVFAYTVGELSKSLPQSDYSAKAANSLLPAANQLLATTQRFEGGDNIFLPTTTRLLNELSTSGTPLFDAVQKLGLLPLIQKIMTYRNLLMDTK